MTTYTFTNLNLPDHSIPSGLNDSGEVVGYYDVNNVAPLHGFLYNNGAYTTLDDPSSVGGFGTNAVAINASGEVAGYYVDSSNIYHGFLYNNGAYTTLNGPSAVATEALAINTSGEVAGYYTDSSLINHGFLYNNGAYTTLTDPSAGPGGTVAQAINTSGEVAGYYNDSSGIQHGFLYNNGAYTTLTDPSAGPTGSTVALAINTSGEVAGSYQDSSGTFHGFLYNNGAYTTLDDPSAVGGTGTGASAINASGEVAGSYQDSSKINHGFLYNNGAYTTLDDPSAVGGIGTVATAINTSGEVAGTYFDSSGIAHAFVATLDTDRQPETPSLAAPSSLTVAAGGSAPLGIVLSVVDSDDTLSVSISGLSSYESVTAAGATTTRMATKHGKIVTYTDTIAALPSADWNNGLILNSTYTGPGSPTNLLTVTASNTTAGEVSKAPAQTKINVTDPLATTSPSYQSLAIGTTPVYTFTNLNLPNNSASYGLNDSGEVAGYYQDSSGVTHGFLYNNGAYTTLTDPSASTNQTVAQAINTSGEVAGYYVDSSNTYHGFLYNNGVYTTLDDPSAGTNQTVQTVAQAINASGEVAGYYVDSSGTAHGFLYNNGAYTTLTDPSAGATGTYAFAINTSGEVTGYYGDSSGTLHGFLYNNGAYTTLTDPSASTNQTVAQAINASGEVAGYYADGSGYHGFLYNNGAYTTLDDPSATGGTFAIAINTSGEVAGYYQEGNGYQGFLYNNGAYTTLGDPSAGPTGTFPLSINTSGEVAGYYYDSSGLTQHAFVAIASDTDGLPETPTLTAPSSLTVAAGGSAPLGIILKSVDSDDTLSVSISGVPGFESVTAAGATPTIAKHGSTFTYTFNALPSADWNNGLIIHSTYPGKGHPTNPLTVTASNTTAGESSTAPARTISVTDPPSLAIGTTPTYTFTNLNLPNYSISSGVNDSGEVAGYYSSNGTHGFLYNNGVYTTLDDPSAGPTGTYAVSINTSGEVAGYYADSGNTYHGFFYNNGAYTTLDDPSAIGNTIAQAINASSEVTGYYQDSSGTYHGFLYDNGAYTTLDDPSAGLNSSTYAVAINTSGEVAGYYLDSSNAYHGFLYNNGAYTTLTDPSAGLNSTYAVAINTSGEVAGYYLDGSFYHGFLYNNGVYTTLDGPSAGPGGNTFAQAINASGEVTGYYQDSSGTYHGFLYNNGAYTILDDPSAGPGGTLAVAINTSGEVAGYYGDSSGPAHAFVASASDTDTAPEKPTLTAPSSLTVAAGGSAPLGIVLTAVDSDDTLSVSISGVPAFESVTAAGASPTITKHGSTFTYTFNALPSADWNNGLILHSTFKGKGHPTNPLTVTASNTTAGEASTAAARTISVTDPPLAIVVGAYVEPDDDSTEQAALKLNVGNANIGSATASMVPFTIAGLDSEDSGTVTFTDVNNNTVTVNVTASQTSYTANLTSLSDSAISSSMQITTDAAGNSFTPVAGNSVTLDQDTNNVPAGLLGYWNFNGTAADATGDGNNLSLFGGATYGTGQYGQALSLNGTEGQYAQATTDNSAFDFGSSDFTIQVWAKFNSIASEPTLIEKFSGSDGPGWTLNLRGGNSIEFYTTSSSGIIDLVTPAAIPTGSWQEFIIERGGSTFNLYWDGNLVASTTSSAALTASPNNLLIGARNSQDGRNFTVDGFIDDVGIWNRALSASEIANSWNAGSGSPPLLGEQAALSLTVNGGQPIGAGTASAVPFTVGGLQSDDSGTVSFSDGSHAPVPVSITNGVPAASTVNLSGLNDGAITATLHLNNDAAGNSFTNVITAATLDTDRLAETPTLTAPSSLTVAAGGSAPLGIILKSADSDDTLSVSVSGVPGFESVTAAGATPTITKHGSTFTYTFNALPSADWNNGLIIHSTYPGKGHPTNSLTVTASNTTAGESSTAAARTISVTDPPATTTPSYQSLALLNQFMAAGLHEQNGIPIVASSRTEINSGGEAFLTQPHH